MRQLMTINVQVEYQEVTRRQILDTQTARTTGSVIGICPIITEEIGARHMSKQPEQSDPAVEAARAIEFNLSWIPRYDDGVEKIANVIRKAYEPVLAEKDNLLRACLIRINPNSQLWENIDNHLKGEHNAS